jgi:hypothetical protein
MSVHYARGVTTRMLAGLVPATHLDDVELVVSELVTNAVRSARAYARRRGWTWEYDDTPVHLGIACGPRWTRIDVRDPDPGVFIPRPGGLEDESGRGLVIIDALTVDWWPTYTHHDKTVHALIAMPKVTLTDAELAEASE